MEKQTEMEVEKSLVFSMAILQKVPIFQERDAKKLEGILDDISKKKIENNNTIIT